LFANCNFLLGRETPIYNLQYMIMSLGGSYILQECLPEDEAEAAQVMKAVTHICMDRPLEAGTMDKTKEYIQPQYVIDCMNNLFLLPTRPYLPGTVSALQANFSFSHALPICRHS
jgi:hypothetical protein